MVLTGYHEKHFKKGDFNPFHKEKRSSKKFVPEKKADRKHLTETRNHEEDSSLRSQTWFSGKRCSCQDQYSSLIIR